MKRLLLALCAAFLLSAGACASTGQPVAAVSRADAEAACDDAIVQFVLLYQRAKRQMTKEQMRAAAAQGKGPLDAALREFILADLDGRVSDAYRALDHVKAVCVETTMYPPRDI